MTTGSRRDDVTASVGDLRVSESGRFAVVVDYERQRAVAVHSLDGLLKQLADDDVTSGLKQRCRAHFDVVKPPTSMSGDYCNGVSSASPHSQPVRRESEITLEEFSRRCKRPAPPPVSVID